MRRGIRIRVVPAPEPGAEHLRLALALDVHDVPVLQFENNLLGHDAFQGDEEIARFQDQATAGAVLQRRAGHLVSRVVVPVARVGRQPVLEHPPPAPLVQDQVAARPGAHLDLLGAIQHLPPVVDAGHDGRIGFHLEAGVYVRNAGQDSYALVEQLGQRLSVDPHIGGQVQDYVGPAHGVQGDGKGRALNFSGRRVQDSRFRPEQERRLVESVDQVLVLFCVGVEDHLLVRFYVGLAQYVHKHRQQLRPPAEPRRPKSRIVVSHSVSSPY